MRTCDYCHSAIETLSDLNQQVRFCCKSCESLWFLTRQNISPVQENKLKTDEFEYLNKWAQNQSSLKFYIEGLVCASCVHLIEEMPQFLNGVKSVRLDLSESTALIERELHLQASQIAAALKQMGYNIKPIVDQAEVLDQQKSEDRKLLKELAVAGALAGNIMLFTVPIYGGLEGRMAFIFQWVTFFLFLPLLFFSARSFYLSAWRSLQKKIINVDITIVIALWLGFILSVINLIEGRSELYFDSTASFLFLILASRFYMRKIQQKFLKRNVLTQFFQQQLYEVGFSGEKKTAESIEKNETIHLKLGQVVPCDGYLLNHSAQFDLSYLTGESWPQAFGPQSMVFAGSKLLDVSAEVLAVNKLQESQLGQLVKKIDSMHSISEVYKTETDRAAHWLTVVVLSVSALFFVIYSFSSPWEAFQRSLALLIVACPCAIAFGTPMALSLGIKKALKKGYFIRSESFFERLAQIKTIILDKTGTLTEGRLDLVRTFPPQIPQYLKSLVLAAEKNSRHPVAMTLKELWKKDDESENIKVLQTSIKAGFGVEAECEFDNEKVNIQVGKVESPFHQEGLMEVAIQINGQPQAYLFFQEKLRSDSESLVEILYKMKMDVFILTGDLRARAIEFAKKLKVPGFRVFADQSAESKSLVVQENNPCLYVGDGFNDLMALKAAHVSYAIEGQFDVTLSVADVYAPGKGPQGVVELINLSRQVRSVIRGNIFFAVFYNLIAGSMALMGLMNPLVAAILMPISSMILLTHTMARLG